MCICKWGSVWWWSGECGVGVGVVRGMSVWVWRGELDCAVLRCTLSVFGGRGPEREMLRKNPKKVERSCC